MCICCEGSSCVNANFVMKKVTDTCTPLGILAQNAWCPPNECYTIFVNIYLYVIIVSF